MFQEQFDGHIFWVPLGYKPRLANSILAVLIGYLSNLGIPRSGELLRATAMDKYDNIPFQKGFGTIIAERVIDLILLFIFVCIVLLFQLRQQNLQLRLQHKDFAQQIKNQIGERRTSATLSLTSSMRETLVKGRYDYSALKKTEERTFFHQWVISTLEIMIMKNLYSEETGHQESLRLARDAGDEDPPIPALPQSVIDDTAALYASMFERLTGVDF